MKHLKKINMQPSEYAMRGHHESSLIQFKHGTPQIIYNELLEITELPFNPTKKTNMSLP